MSADSLRLETLFASGRLSHRDVDVMMVAAGYLDYAVVADYLRQDEARRHGTAPPPPSSLPPSDVPEVAREIVERICGCQYQDGGATRLVRATAMDVHLRVEGACVHCPQIRYTIDVLKRAIRFRAPEVGAVRIDGTRFEEKEEVPTNSQLTMAMFMKRTGLRYADLDAALDHRGRLRDEDLVALGSRKRIRLELVGT